MKTGLPYLSLGILLLLASVTAAGADTSDDAAHAYARGMQALARKDDRAAFAAFQRAVQQEPIFAEVHYQLGVLYGKQAQWKLAVNSLQTAIKLAPDFVDAHVRLGEAYLIGMARAEAATAPLAHVLQLRPDLSRARRLLGDAYLRQDRIADAIYHLKQIEQDTEARYLLGLAYFQKEAFVEAIPHFAEVIKRKRRHAQAHFSLGNCYLRTGKVAEGRAALRTFEKLSREEEQLASLQRLIGDNPRHLQSRYELAELHIKRTEWEQAEGILKACLAVAPKDEKASELLGYIYLQTEAYPEALAVYGQLVAVDPKNVAYRNRLGIVYMLLEKPRQAIVQFETATRFSTTNPQLYRNLANAYRQIGEQVKAQQAYRHYQTLTQ